MCVWRVSARRGKIIHMTFDLLDIETTKLCQFDYLEVIRLCFGTCIRFKYSEIVSIGIILVQLFIYYSLPFSPLRYEMGNLGLHHS